MPELAIPPNMTKAAGTRAVILAGGKGVRLRPFTAVFPKPLVPLGDRPIIEVLIERLIGFGIVDITLTVGHLAELIKAYFQHRRELMHRMTLRFVDEDEPSGTAGSLARVDGLDRTFFVMNADLFTDIDFDALLSFHRAQGAALTVASHRRTEKIDLGVLQCDKDYRVVGYREKPEYSYDVSMGIYVYEPKVLKFIQPHCYLDFPDLVLRLIKAGEKVCAMPCDCLWLDIGRPDDYAAAQELFASKKNQNG